MATNRNEQTLKVPIPLWGLNTADDETEMNPLFARDWENADIDPDRKGIQKRKGFSQFNTAPLPVSWTGTVTTIGTQTIHWGTGVVLSGVATAGMRVRLASNLYTLSGKVSNAEWTITSNYSDTINTGSFIVSPPSVLGLNIYLSGTTQRLIAWGGGTTFNMGSSTTGEGTNLNDSLTDALRVDSVTFQDQIFYCNGAQFNSWDGSSITDEGANSDPDDPKYISVYTNGNANYLAIFGSGTDAERSQLAFSDVNAPSTWPAGNIYQVGDRDGSGEASRIARIPTGLLLLKTKGIFFFGGIPGASGSLRKVSEIGCPCPWTVKEWEGKVVFVGERFGRLGVFMYTGGNTFVSLAEKLDPTFNALSASTLEKWTAEIYKDKFIVSCTSSSGSNNDRHFSCYLSRPNRTEENVLIWPWTEGSRGFDAAKSFSVSGTNILITGSPTSGYLFREDNGTSDSTADNIFGNAAAIDAYVYTKYFDLGVQDRRKELRSARFNANTSGDYFLKFRLFKDAQTGYTSYDIDLDNTALTWADVEFLVTPWQTQTDKTFPEINFSWPTIYRYYSFGFYNGTVDQDFTVFPFSLSYKYESEGGS